MIHFLWSFAGRHRLYFSSLGSGYLLIASSIIINLLMVPLYLSSLGEYQFGVLMVFLSLVNLLAIGIGWVSGGALRLLGYYAGQGDEAGFRKGLGVLRFLYAGYGALLGLGLIGAALFFAPRLFSTGTPEEVAASRQTLMMTGLYLVPFYLASMDRLALTSRKLQDTANVSQIAGNVVTGILAALWLFKGGGMVGIMVAATMGALISLFITRRALRREDIVIPLRLPSRADKEIWQKIGGRTGLGFFLHGALVIALVSDIVLVGWLGGAREAGVFYLVWKVAEVLVQLIWKISETLGPYFIHMDVRGEQKRLLRVANMTYFGVGALALTAGVTYAVLGSWIVGLWVGVEKVPDNPLAFLLAGGAVFWLSLARLPVVLSGARVTLLQVNRVCGIELAGKLLLTLLLFSRLGYISVLIAINVVHLGGVAYLYYRLLRVSSVGIDKPQVESFS